MSDDTNRRILPGALIAAGVLAALLVVALLSIVGDDTSEVATAPADITDDDSVADTPTDAERQKDPATTTTSDAPTSVVPTTPITAPSPSAARFQSLIYQGTGPGVLVLDQPITEPLLIAMSHDGSRFSVILRDLADERVDRLADEVGEYYGVAAINVTDPAADVIIVSGDGHWSIAISPISETLDRYRDRTSLLSPLVVAWVLDTAPGTTWSDAGTNVVLFEPDAPTTVEFSCAACASDFKVTAMGTDRHELISTTGAYSGTVEVLAGTVLLAITARNSPDGQSPRWTITVR